MAYPLDYDKTRFELKGLYTLVCLYTCILFVNWCELKNTKNKERIQKLKLKSSSPAS